MFPFLHKTTSVQAQRQAAAGRRQLEGRRNCRRWGRSTSKQRASWPLHAVCFGSHFCLVKLKLFSIVNFKGWGEYWQPKSKMSSEYRCLPRSIFILLTHKGDPWQVSRADGEDKSTSPGAGILFFSCQCYLYKYQSGSLRKIISEK